MSLARLTADHSAFNFCVPQTLQQSVSFYMFRLKLLENYKGFPQQCFFPQFVNKTKAQTPFLHIPEACSRTDGFLLSQYLKHLQCKTPKGFRHGGDVSELATTHPGGSDGWDNSAKLRELWHTLSKTLSYLWICDRCNSSRSILLETMVVWQFVSRATLHIGYCEYPAQDLKATCPQKG